jgi:hypothetical protein
MRLPRICIAGIEVDSKRHLRPVTAMDDLITRSLLVEEGGRLELGTGLELGPTTATPNRPEAEDHFCQTSNFEALGVLSGQEYCDLLTRVEGGDLGTAFGPGLRRNGNTYAMEPDGGANSLACIRAKRDARLSIDFEKPYLRLPEQVKVKVTDVRFFESDQRTLRRDVVADVNARLATGVGAFLMFGLSRPWARPGEDKELQWLQLNGICLEDSPLGATP